MKEKLKLLKFDRIPKEINDGYDYRYTFQGEFSGVPSLIHYPSNEMKQIDKTKEYSLEELEEIFSL